MKKKININMPKLSIGGMEKALIDLLNNSNWPKNYDLNLLIGYVTDNKLLELLPKEVHVNLLWKHKWNILAKVVVGIKLFLRLLFPKKYYASISYAYQHGILAKITRRESNKNIIFIHGDISKRPKEDLERLQSNVEYEKFANIVCVSNTVKDGIKKLYPNYKGNIVVANNYIDYDNILKNSKEKVLDLKKEKKTTFLSVARHDEKPKQLARIIEATKKLNAEGFEFRVVFVGDGPDHQLYLDLKDKYNLSNLIILGSKINPYPYFKLADALVFSSKHEGYGLVLNEARILGLPIITTDVADAAMITKEGYGILCDNSSEGVYEGMKKFLQNGYKLEKKFNAQKFNDKITKELDTLLK